MGHNGRWCLGNGDFGGAATDGMFQARPSRRKPRAFAEECVKTLESTMEYEVIWGCKFGRHRPKCQANQLLVREDHCASGCSCVCPNVVHPFIGCTKSPFWVGSIPLGTVVMGHQLNPIMEWDTYVEAASFAALNVDSSESPNLCWFYTCTCLRLIFSFNFESWHMFAVRIMIYAYLHRRAQLLSKVASTYVTRAPVRQTCFACCTVPITWWTAYLLKSGWRH